MLAVGSNGKNGQTGDNFFGFFVQDNGIGIRKDYHERIFQIFKRVHTDRNIEGTGVGLSIVKKIVEQHGGSIHVISEPGKGSTFEFTVPKAA